MGIIILIGVLFLILLFFKNNNEKNKHSQNKIILGLIYYIIFFIVYYFVVALISSIPLFFLSKLFESNSDNGLWAYSLILGIVLAPILSIITTIKIIKKDKNN